MSSEPKAQSGMAKFTMTKFSEELSWIEATLKAASEFGLEAEVVWEMCDTIRKAPDVSIEQAAIRAVAEWDL